MATVDNSFVFLTGCLLWMPLEFPTMSGPHKKNVLFGPMGSAGYGFAMKWAPPLRSGFHQGNFPAVQGGTLGDSFVIG